jgi:photosystem I P700 chlorophyll a apoprotein A1
MDLFSLVRDCDATLNYNNLLDPVIKSKRCYYISFKLGCIFLGFHSFGLYIHNDTMQALGRPQDMFSGQNIKHS